MFLKGFEGWRHARQLQDELLDTLEAGVGADDVNVATLRGSCSAGAWPGWLAGAAQLMQVSNARSGGARGARSYYQ